MNESHWASLEDVNRNARPAYIVVPSLALGLVALWVLMHIEELWALMRFFG